MALNDNTAAPGADDDTGTSEDQEGAVLTVEISLQQDGSYTVDDEPASSLDEAMSMARKKLEEGANGGGEEAGFASQAKAHQPPMMVKMREGE